MHRRAGIALCVVVLLVVGAGGVVVDAVAEQASAPGSPAAAGLDIGWYHSCAVLGGGGLRCWGLGASGQLGYGNTATIGDDETPASAGPVNLGGHAVTAIATGDYHSCALLDDGTVRCWGFGGDGRLGYANTNNVVDPGSVGAVDLGADGVTGRPLTATAITAGAAHTCAILGDGSVRCWGFARGGYAFQGDGRLGYANNDNVGDDETPGSVGPVKLGAKAVAISAGGAHTCALLEGGGVRCWGLGSSGQLGYGDTSNVGDNETPDQAGPVSLGGLAVAISAGGAHTCALLEGGGVSCWGQGGAGQLGYGTRSNVGSTAATTPGAVGTVDLGGQAQAISAGSAHTCAVLAGGSVRCWGLGASGRLGYGNQENIGDGELPSSVGPVDLGSGRTAVAISAGHDHTCARLDSGGVRCWGYGAYGRLGYCNQVSIGDDETPGLAGPVNLEAGDGGAGCPAVPSGPTATSVPPAASVLGSAPTTPPPPGLLADGLAAQQIRAAGLRRCVRRVSRHALRQRNRVRHLPTIARAIAFRRIARRARHGRGLCLVRYGRTPGRVGTLSARATGPRTITLSFQAAGTDHAHPPAAHGYLIGQSTHPIRTRRDFRAAHALCRGRCVFDVTLVGATLTQTIIGLDRRRTYYYAIAARDNVSRRLGPRSHTIQARTP